jgi:hypothetical protein
MSMADQLHKRLAEWTLVFLSVGFTCLVLFEGIS